MAPKVRVEYPGAYHHVINRGNYRSWIFESEGVLLKLLAAERNLILFQAFHVGQHPRCLQYLIDSHVRQCDVSHRQCFCALDNLQLDLALQIALRIALVFFISPPATPP